MKLTISMATYDDYDGVYFTVQSLRLHHNLPVGTEILILDNNPSSAHGRAVSALAKQIPEIRILEITDRVSSFIKYEVFNEAAGDIILGLDCHVLLQPGFIDHLMELWEAMPDSHDLISGPLIYNDLSVTSVKMEPRWRGHDYGCWGSDAAAMHVGLPFEVPMQGMGCFSLLRKYAPRIGPQFRGFGAEEWYIAEKVRQNGGRVMCAPKLGWNHRFDWPQRNFPLRIEDKVRNYYLGWLELYGSLKHPRIVEMTKHWRSILSSDQLNKIIQTVCDESIQPIYM